jgi:hypothetical protein
MDSQDEISDKEQKFLALKHTLEETKLNHELMQHIQEGLTSLMIDYNQGFIISLSI